MIAGVFEPVTTHIQHQTLSPNPTIPDLNSPSLNPRPLNTHTPRRTRRLLHVIEHAYSFVPEWSHNEDKPIPRRKGWSERDGEGGAVLADDVAGGSDLDVLVGDG